MAPNMIEKVARAICTARGVDPDLVGAIGADTDTMGPQADVAMERWRFYIPAAKAAVAAVAESLTKPD